MTRKVIFWLAEHETLIPADQVPGAIADAVCPPTERNELQGQPLNDPNAFNRLEVEREHAKKLREKYPNLPNDYKFSKGELSGYLESLGFALEVRHRSPESIEAAENTIFWYNAARDAAEWFDQFSVAPRDAAMLLCDFHPKDDRADPQEETSSETGPEDFKRLLQVFEDVANTDSQPRTLLRWLDVARDGRLNYHSWIDEYANAMLLVQKDGEQNAISGTPEIAEPPLFTKAEILAVNWPMPPGAPPLENILNERPKWVSEACVLVGKPGGGASGSHLWKPAMLAVCLATTRPQKRWYCNKAALTNYLRNNFSRNFAQWEGFAENL